MIADILETLGVDGQPRLVELGKIKIGGLGNEKTASSGRKYRVPEKHDYFTVTTLHRGADGRLIDDKALMETLLKQWGDPDGKLRQLPVFLLSDDLEDVLQVAHVWYGRKSCGARSDGKTVTWFYHPETMQPYDPPLVEPFRPEILEWTVPGKGNDKVKMFKTHSVFNCVIAADNSRWGGVYKFRTTSIISLKQLYASLVHISQLTGGVLIGMPLMLKVRPVQVSPNGQVSTVHVVHVELMGKDLFEIQKKALLQAEYKTVHRQKLLATQTQYRKLLVAPGEESNGEAAATAAEFQPEAAELDTPAAPEGGYSLLNDGDSVVVDTAPPSDAPGPATDEGSGADFDLPDSEPEAPPVEIKTAVWDAMRPSIFDWYAANDRAVDPETIDKALQLFATNTNYTAKDRAKGKPMREALAKAIVERRFELATGTIRD